MNAIEFVKKFGLDEAIDLANRNKTSIGYLSVEHHNLNQEELKQIVEAFELVEKHGGFKNAKYDAQYLFADWDCRAPMERRLKQAIELVEKCNASD